jgi:hypothetical protein
MRHRLLTSVVAVGAAIFLGASTSAPVAAQASKAAAAAAKDIRTPWGDPDLQGVWTGSTITPLERPKDLAGKEFLTEQEAAALEKRANDNRLVERAPADGDPGTYNQIWFDPSTKGVPDRRTSLIVDPPDGKIPYTAEAQQAQSRSRARYGKGPYNSYLDLDTGERCITDGPPIYFGGYNNNYQIVQAPGYVAIVHELYREHRIIPLNGRPHIDVPQWVGDSVGHWEGNTLVVDTAVFIDKSKDEWQDAWRANRAATHIVERFTRVDGETLDYQFTWEDPTMFTRPWTARWPLTTNQKSRGVTEGGLFEYACHEGNLAMSHVLSGARAQEKAAEDAAKKGSR